MIVTMVPYCPAEQGTNLGYAYNEQMRRLREGDWACFIDHDACFTTPDWYRQLEAITARLSEPCVLTACTNRVGSPWQRVEGVGPDEHSMAYHRRVGARLRDEFGTEIEDVTGRSLMSGVVILLSKKTWETLGGFADGFLGVDNQLHQAARDRGFKVYLMRGVYVYHWYRAEQEAAASGAPESGGASSRGTGAVASATGGGQCPPYEAPAARVLDLRHAAEAAEAEAGTSHRRAGARPSPRPSGAGESFALWPAARLAQFDPCRSGPPAAEEWMRKKGEPVKTFSELVHDVFLEAVELDGARRAAFIYPPTPARPHGIPTGRAPTQIHRPAPRAPARTSPGR